MGGCNTWLPRRKILGVVIVLFTSGTRLWPFCSGAEKGERWPQRGERQLKVKRVLGALLEISEPLEALELATEHIFGSHPFGDGGTSPSCPWRQSAQAQGLRLPVGPCGGSACATRVPNLRVMF